MSTAAHPSPAAGSEGLLDKLVAAHQGRCGALLGLLEELQKADAHNHLPEAVARQAAAAMGLPLSQVFSVLTFYSFFNLRPQGQHTVTICRGTACHTRGSRNLLAALLAALPLPKDQDPQDERLCVTTADNQLTARTVACFGQCALAPVVEVDHTIHGHMNRQKLLSAVAHLGHQEVRR